MTTPDPDPDRQVTADAAAYTAVLLDLHTARQAAIIHGTLRSLFDYEAAVAAVDDHRRQIGGLT